VVFFVALEAAASAGEGSQSRPDTHNGVSDFLTAGSKTPEHAPLGF
jgi:hypothetical protein